MFIKKLFLSSLTGLYISASLLYPVLSVAQTTADSFNLAQEPLFVSQSVPPLAMLVMGRNHKMFYEAYNDSSDLDGKDGDDNLGLEVGYEPDLADGYYGYFESNLCYDYTTNSGLSVFTPVYYTDDRKCPSDSAEWSGDFLNYVTTSRIDALRKVLYGGSRVVDTATTTILQRTFIPQDAHAWGKEYASITEDGYDITEYTALSLPSPGRRHILANMSLSDNGQPLMRVMKNTPFRVWQWLSIERPIGDTQCFDDNNNSVQCVNTSGSTSGNSVEIVSSEQLTNLVRTTYDISGTSGHPNNATDFANWEDLYAVPARLDGTDTDLTTINDSGNPHGSNDNYLTIIEGQIIIPVDGDYTFYVDGDDAIQFLLYDDSGSELVNAIYPGGHGTCNCNDHDDSATLTAGTYDIKYRHEERGGGDSYVLKWLAPDEVSTSTLAFVDNYDVNVQVCDKALIETQATGSVYIPSDEASLLGSCKQYPNQQYKPIGLLQEYGEDDDILFGLLTGSYENNLQGGVLRKNIRSFADEIDLNTGMFQTNVSGIVKNIDLLKIWGFSYGTDEYFYQQEDPHLCGFTFDRAITNSECNSWGNPLGEMVYENLRYFSGASGPTNTFDYGANSIDESELGLTTEGWVDPYGDVVESPADVVLGGGNEYCAKPVQLLISDLNPSYDTGILPGSDFPLASGEQKLTTDTPALSGLDVSAQAAVISQEELGGGGDFFIGQSLDEANPITETGPDPKNVINLGRVRGLSPEEPSKFGGYSAAALSYFGRVNDLSSTAETEQLLDTYSIAYASPVPPIKIDVQGKAVTLVPFAKTVGQNDINLANGLFQGTNQIVDFYVTELTDTEGTFLINFEDVEAGGDHDMDAIVEYHYKVEGNRLTIELDSQYARGGAIQHIGYVISGVGVDKTDGVNGDGVYLDVRDVPSNNDDSYFPFALDTLSPGETELGLQSSREFVVDVSNNVPAATFLENPLWYAAKWGGFVQKGDENNPRDNTLPAANDLADDASEWDIVNNITGATGSDNIPDNYYLVSSPLTLQTQLSNVFEDASKSNSAAASASVSGGFLGVDSLLFESGFDPSTWTGRLEARRLNASDGSIIESDENGEAVDSVWDSSERLDDLVAGQGFDTARKVISYRKEPRADGSGTGTPNGRGVPFEWTADGDIDDDTFTLAQVQALGDGINEDDREEFVDYIRGDRSNEAPNGIGFRSRESVHGDIVNSDPIYVPQPREFYPNVWPGSFAAGRENSKPYSDFRAALADRRPVLYYGANDGMFRGVNGDEVTADDPNPNLSSSIGGQEILAYVPAEVLGNLSELADPNYTHRFYANGPSNFNDVFFGQGDNEWHTVLASGLGAGGQAVFALDITDPHGITGNYPSFSEANAEELVLWEFSDEDDPDLGYTYGRPSLVRMANGEWAAVFGNGYKNTDTDGIVSSTGNAVVYVVAVEDGSLIAKFDTGVGKDDDPLGLSRPNGIGYINTIDVNGDFVIDLIYGGDLFGNVWKFDVSSENDNNWGSAFNSGSEPEPIYQAKDASGIALPITTQIQVGTHPTQPGENYMLYFGTGRYITTTDSQASGQLTQAFHGLWDDGTTISGRSELENQALLTPVVGDDGNQYRRTEDDEIDWDNGERGWIIDLTQTAENLGERQVSNAILSNGRIIWTTLIPSEDLCQGGGSGWVMEMDATNGGPLDSSPFDTDADNLINSDDLIDIDGDGVGEEAVTGTLFTAGIPTTPTFIDIQTDEESTIIPGQGASGNTTGSSGGSDGGSEENENTNDETSKKRFITGSDGITEATNATGGNALRGRQSWRELK